MTSLSLSMTLKTLSPSNSPKSLGLSSWAIRSISASLLSAPSLPSRVASVLLLNSSA